MQSRSIGEYKLEVVIREGVAYSRRVSSAKERTLMPRDIIRDPPEWVRVLVDKSAPVLEFLAAMDPRARDARSVEHRQELLTVFEQFVQWEAGRRAADLLLGPDFIHRLTVDKPAMVAPPAIVVFVDNGPSASLNPWQDEFVWSESELQQRNLDLRITKVWLNNSRPFVELFLFDGPDLQGRLARFARVQTPISPLPIELDEPSLRGRARSLLGGEFNAPGRRFSASAQLSQVAEQFFATAVAGLSTFGTANLTRAPQFSWDGYNNWLTGQQNIPPPPKMAALRIQWDFQIDDVEYGITAASITSNYTYVCPGTSRPIQWQSSLALLNIPQPWFGGVGLPPPAFRWGVNMDDALDLEFAGNLEGLLLGLAGSPPNSMLILPGHSTAIPNAPQHWGLIEIGRTVDDATIVFYP
jgi:hypothetical protein